MYHTDHRLSNQVVTKNDKRCVLFIKIKKTPSSTTVDQLYEKFTQC